MSKLSTFVLLCIFLTSWCEGATWKKISASAFGGSGTTAGTALIASQCPVGFIFVPKNLSYSVVDFCVMKYEAKNDGYGTAISQAVGLPWAGLVRSAARSACQALGKGFDLISNDQWQTIARNIAGVAGNWNTGIVGSGQLNRGHSDNSPTTAYPASSDDNNACLSTGQTCSATVWDSQRRTHELSNGEKIWDFAGNRSEWVTNDSNVSHGAHEYISLISSGDFRQTRYGAATGTFCATPGVSPYCGMGRAFFNSTSGAVARGGDFSSDIYVGIFAVNLEMTITDINNAFRCVYAP